MKRKLSLVLAGIMGTSPLFASINASNVVSYQGECYNFNPNTGKYELNGGIINYPVSSLSVDDIISKLRTGIDKTSNGMGCDRFVVYYTTPQDDKSEGITVQKMAKPINPFSKSDFITIKQAKSSYFIGISDKLQGAGTAYWIYRDDEVGKNRTVKHVFAIERINWLNFFANYIHDYCKQTNGIPPYIIYNQMAFLNATGAIGQYIKDHPNVSPSTITKNNVPALENPGFFKLPQSICEETVPEIEQDLADIQTYPQHGSKGYNYNLYGDDSDKLFTDNGFVINYPYLDFNHIDQIIGEFFTTFMFVNNIPRGIMFSNNEIKTTTRHWTSGKWPWNKKIHSERKWDTSSTSYDIIYAQYIQPFGSYSFTKDWSNIDLSYVASVNNLPAVTRQLIMLTPDNHQITHVFKKGGEIAGIGNWHYEKEVSRKLHLNWVRFIITVAAITTIAYVGTLYFTSGLAAGGFGFGNYLSLVASNPGWLVGNLVGGTGLIGGGWALFAAGGTLAATGSIFNSSWFYENKRTNNGNNTVFSQIMKNLNNDVITSSSLRVQQVQIIPQLIEKVQPQNMVSPTIYKVILKNTPMLGESDRVIPESEFLTDYGTYFNMYMYANHTDIGKDFYSGSQVASWARSFINNMELKGTGTFMNPGNAITTIMQREWK